MDNRDEDALQESSMDGSTGSDQEESEQEQSWISWFCSIRGNEFFCEVDEDYIHDEFNLTNLASEVPYFDYALDTILDVDSPNADLLTEEQQETVDAAAELLYGLIHARYILSSKGLNAMYDKYQDVEFGRCSRVLCEGQSLLPVGQSDLPRKFTVSTYCPRCNDIYFPKSGRHANIDGAYFGTTFPHLFLMTFPACVPPAPTGVFVPRVFGFRIRREPIPEATETSAEQGEARDPAPRGALPAAGAAGVPIAADGGAARGDGPGSVVVYGAGPTVRSVGPTGAAPSAGVAVRSHATPPQVGGRGRDVATVLPRDVMASARRAGHDDFFDEDELEGGGAPASAAAGGAGALGPRLPHPDAQPQHADGDALGGAPGAPALREGDAAAGAEAGRLESPGGLSQGSLGAVTGEEEFGSSPGGAGGDREAVGFGNGVGGGPSKTGAAAPPARGEDGEPVLEGEMARVSIKEGAYRAASANRNGTSPGQMAAM